MPNDQISLGSGSERPIVQFRAYRPETFVLGNLDFLELQTRVKRVRFPKTLGFQGIAPCVGRELPVALAERTSETRAHG